MTFSGWRERLREWARTIKREVAVLWIAARDPRTPIIAKVVAAMVAAYALSPIDLIPDFIPVLGYLDDVIIVPLGIMLALKLIPNHLTAEFRAHAQLLEGRPTSRAGLTFVLSMWILACAVIIWWGVGLPLGLNPHRGKGLSKYSQRHFVSTQQSATLANTSVRKGGSCITSFSVRNTPPQP